MANQLTYFSIIRYVPDPIREEQINIGIIAINPDIKFGIAKFTEDFDRVRRFGSENIQFLKDFAEYLKNQIPREPFLFPGKLLSAEQLKEIAINWQNSIQFSEPKISKLSVEEVIDREFKRFIPSPPMKREVALHKRKVIRSAKGYLSQALKARFRQPKIIQQLLKTDEQIEGKRDVYTLPLVIKNEHLYLGASALSFTILDINKLVEEVRATAWIIEDVKNAQPQLRLAILAKPPKRDDIKVNQIYEKWKFIYTELGSEFIEENKLEKWARDVVERLPILN